MRLFTAIDLPAEVVERIDRLIAHLKPTARLKWSPAENLHITTRFIGEWPEERLPELRSALESLPSRDPLHMSVRGLGFFPNPHSPRVFWAGIEATPELKALAADTDAELQGLGLEREERPYSPHLTLARIKTPVPMQALREAIAALPSTDFGEFMVDRHRLYLSRQSGGGSVYTQLAEFLLRK